MAEQSTERLVMNHQDPLVFDIAIIQQPPVFLNGLASLTKACCLIQEAAKRSDIVIFPETWLPGYPVWLDYAPNAALWDYAPAKSLYRLLLENALTVPGPVMSALQATAHESDTHVIMGAHERQGGSLYNTILFLHSDGITYQIHRKLVPTYTERLIWARGDGSTLSAFQTPHATIGGLVCWEHWMPLARAAMHAQHETLHVAQWPSVKELHQLASRHYAFEGQCFVAAAGCVLQKSDVIQGISSLRLPDKAALELLEAIPGAESDLLLRGGSAVIAPDSTYVVGPVWDEAAIVYAQIDPALISEGLMALDTTGHYARPDVFSLTVNDTPQRDMIFTSSTQ